MYTHWRQIIIAISLASFSSLTNALDSPSFGNELISSNTDTETKINSSNVAKLKLDWSYTTDANKPDAEITTRPALYKGVLYFPDWGGNLHAVDEKTGQLIWKKTFYGDYSIPGNFMLLSRHTPAVTKDMLFIGNEHPLPAPICEKDPATCIPHDGAIVIAVDRINGNLIWRTKVDSHIAAKITGSPVYYNGVVYVSVSSWEEEFSKSAVDVNAKDPNTGLSTTPYPCCTFRGHIVALDAKTGNILWDTYTTPGENVPQTLKSALIKKPGDGFWGAAIYSSPSIDTKRGLIYVGTGNNYRVPEIVQQCEDYRRGNLASPPSLPKGLTCDKINNAVGNYVGSLLALKLKDGKIKWTYTPHQYDSWVHACESPDGNTGNFVPPFGFWIPDPIGNIKNCNKTIGPDYGFSQPPVIAKGAGVDIVGAGNKDGMFYALNPANGKLKWKSQVGPGGVLGGMTFTSSTDGKRIYVGLTNSQNVRRDVNKPFISAAFDNPFCENPVDTDICVNNMGHPMCQIALGAYGLNIGYCTVNPNRPRGGSLNSIVGLPNLDSSGPAIEYADGRFEHGPWTLINPPNDIVADGINTINVNGVYKTSASFWAALDVKNGNIIWQRPALGDVPFAGFGFNFANGVLYVGQAPDSAGNGYLLALDAETGKVLFDLSNAIFAKEGVKFSGPANSGPTIINGKVYWGTGGGVTAFGFLLNATHWILGDPIYSNKLYTFSLPADTH